MVTMSQRIAELRAERGMSRAALSLALGLPKNAAEKFETGRQTPTQEQQEKISAFFGVSVFYLRGETSDRTSMGSWMEAALNESEPDPTPAEQLRRPPKTASAPSGDSASILNPLPGAVSSRAACSTQFSRCSNLRRARGFYPRQSAASC